MDLTKIVPTELFKEIYVDLAKPGVQNVGKAIGTILGLGNTILLPLHLLNERASLIAKRNFERFRLRLEGVNPDTIVEPAPEIAVPILERLLYINDDQIADLYASLLASASRTDSPVPAHPSYIKIIESLTPDEALILGYLAESDVVPYETLRAGWYMGYARRYRMVVFPTDLGLRYPEEATMFCENLEGLGILVDMCVPLKLKAHYKHVARASKKVLSKWREEQPNVTFHRERGHYHITQLGAQLVIACGYDEPEVIESLLRFWRIPGEPVT